MVPLRRKGGSTMSMRLFERVKAYVEHRRHFGEHQTPSWPDLPEITENQEVALTAAYHAAVQRNLPVTAEELERAVAQAPPPSSAKVHILPGTPAARARS
jgi:hypothetical protein